MMKQLTISTFLVSSLFANSLQSVDASFSTTVQSQLLKKFNSGHTKSLHSKKTYRLTKGWNKLITPKDGVDVIKTFKNILTVKFVVTYDNESKYWAGFTQDETILKDLKQMLLLKYIEPNISFFVLATKDTQVTIKSLYINETCKKLISSKKYGVLYDSGLTKLGQANATKNISISSRYHSHEYRGIYNDTRVALIYPKVSAGKITEKYGPAEPTVSVEYAKEYENSEFFIYDYLEKNCYKGSLPSPKFPPLPVLNKLK